MERKLEFLGIYYMTSSMLSSLFLSLSLSGRTVLLHLVFLVDSIFLLTLWIDPITVWWPPEFLMSHLLIFY